jgi:hypothetical protein
VIGLGIEIRSFAPLWLGLALRCFAFCAKPRFRFAAVLLLPQPNPNLVIFSFAICTLHEQAPAFQLPPSSMDMEDVETWNFVSSESNTKFLEIPEPMHHHIPIISSAWEPPPSHNTGLHIHHRAGFPPGTTRAIGQLSHLKVALFIIVFVCVGSLPLPAAPFGGVCHLRGARGGLFAGSDPGKFVSISLVLC